MRVQEELLDGLLRMEDLPDGDFERDRSALFERAPRPARGDHANGPHCVDARLVAIQLAEVPLDACLGDMLQLERETRERLVMSRPGFDPISRGYGVKAHSRQARMPGSSPHATPRSSAGFTPLRRSPKDASSQPATAPPPRTPAR